MKRVFVILVTAFICLSFFGCADSSNGKPATGNQQKTVDDVLNEKMADEGQPSAVSPGTEVFDQYSVTTASSGISEQPASSNTEVGDVDVDLTKLSSTMVYSEVYNMVNTPENYMGKRVRMNGSFAYAEGDGKYYYACLISDATACCAQGIEFILKDERKFPEEYPEKGAEITVVGIFDTYNEGDYRYCQLIDAVME